MLLVYLGVTSVLALVEASCPDSRLFLPCKCITKSTGDDATCQNAEQTDVLRAIQHLRGRDALYWLTLRENHLPSLPEDAFKGIKVKHLTITSCDLENIHPDAFVPLAKVIEFLDLSNNKLDKVPSEPLSNLRNVTFLNLNYNNIDGLLGRAFRGMTRLQRLTLFGNKIKNIANDAFSELSGSLMKMNLAENELQRVPTAALSSLSSLQTLEMNDNKIYMLNIGDFQGLTHLDSLSLVQNKIKVLPDNAFNHLSKLTLLDLDSNKINTIEDNAFKGLEDTLVWLKLGNNKLDSFPLTALKDLRKLRQLDLKANYITHIPSDAFLQNGHSIKFLNLGENRIETLPDGSLDHLDQVEWLYLFSNRIAHISRRVVRPIFKTVKLLDIHDNPLICDEELLWYKEWIQIIKSKTDRGIKPILIDASCRLQPSGKVVPITSIGLGGTQPPTTSTTAPAHNSLEATPTTGASAPTVFTSWSLLVLLSTSLASVCV